MECSSNAIQLCLSNKVLREVVKETTTVGLWKKIENSLHVQIPDELIVSKTLVIYSLDEKKVLWQKA